MIQSLLAISEKNTIVQAIVSATNANPDLVDQLVRMFGGAVGAGVGKKIADFLGIKGIVGTVAGGLFGYGIASLGNSTRGVDSFGIPYKDLT